MMRRAILTLGVSLIGCLLVACGGDSEESAPTLAATLAPSLTFTPFVTETPIATPAGVNAEATEAVLSPEETEEPEVQFVVEAAEGEAIDPPVSVVMPEGWVTQNNTALVQDIFMDEARGNLRVIPFSYYTGPVSGGTGFIVLVWGFDSYAISNPLAEDFGEINLWRDGLRLLRLALLEPECNIGTQTELEYQVGGLPAVGTYFAAVDCPESVDTRGWFAGLRQDGINFIFYVYTEPIEAMDGSAPDELQAILDTVAFHVGDLLLTATASAPLTPEPTPG